MSIISKKQNLILYFLLMMDIAKSETFKKFCIWNEALLFSIKLNKTALQSVPKITLNHFTKLLFKYSLSLLNYAKI